MPPQDLFGVAIRTTGLWIILYGIYILIHALAWLHQAPPTAADTNASDKKCAEQSPDKNNHGGQYFFYGTVLVFMGAALISLADKIVATSYAP